MLTKAVILIIIGLAHGQPVAKQAGTYPTGADCKAAATAFVAAAMAAKVEVAPLCIRTPWAYTGRDS